MTAPTWQTDRLRDQLARAIAKGDHAAELILRARIAGDASVRRMGVRPLPEITESELRFLFGDR